MDAKPNRRDCRDRAVPTKREAAKVPPENFYADTLENAEHPSV